MKIKPFPLPREGQLKLLSSLSSASLQLLHVFFCWLPDTITDVCGLLAQGPFIAPSLPFFSLSAGLFFLVCLFSEIDDRRLDLISDETSGLLYSHPQLQASLNVT